MKTILEQLHERIASECNAVDTEALYAAMLDEAYSFEEVGGPFEHLQPSRVLKEMSPTDWRCGVADYSDSLALVEIKGSEYRYNDCDEIRDAMVDELNAELAEIQSELDDLGGKDDDGNESEGSIRTRLEAKEGEIATLETHAF